MKYLFLFIALLTSAFAQEKFDTLKVGAKEYKRVNVTRKDDAYISFTHESGTARILRADMLPADVKVVGGFDAKKAKIVLDKEKELTKAPAPARVQPTSKEVPANKPTSAQVVREPEKPERLKLQRSKLDSRKLEKSGGLR